MQDIVAGIPYDNDPSNDDHDPMIKRRQFISGVAVAVGATAQPFALSVGATKDNTHGLTPRYPPALTGLRGSHKGAFETAHALAFGGQSWALPEHSHEPDYDLIVVGAGISGLATAWFWQQRLGKDARILILDNHDDFGGHAKRNEFNVDGHPLIGYGGSQSIDGPAHYSEEARYLLTSLGIETSRFYQYYDRHFAKRHNLGSFWFFDKAHYGVNRLVTNPTGEEWLGVDAPTQLADIIAAMPLSQTGQAALLTLLTSTKDWLAGMTADEKLAYLRSKSYEDYLRQDLVMPEEVVLLLRQRSHGLWAVGYDALSAKAAAEAGEPGTTTLGLDELLWGDSEDEPYIFHFPDGNASIARLLVRSLIPGSAPGNTMDDVVTAKFDYQALDRDDQTVRLRLNATAIDVRHRDPTQPALGISVGYVQDGQAYRVGGRYGVMACYNHMIPYLCPELPATQAAAMSYGEKAPLVYANVALNNWRAFREAGLYHFHAVQDFWAYGALDFPVSTPGYTFSKNPDEPILLHLVHTPTVAGLPAKEQYREGRRAMLALDFGAYERAMRQQLTAMLGPYGFAFERDVAAITVNRWPHGYAYEYIDLWDPPEWGPNKGPHIEARKPFGHIGIANADSSAYAYVNGAIDAAVRAVDALAKSALEA